MFVLEKIHFVRASDGEGWETDVVVVAKRGVIEIR